MNSKSTRTAILDLAQQLCQERGFNGFSFRDLSAELGIKSASVHYHFATKEDLGVALVERYQRAFSDQLHALSAAGISGADQLRRFTVIIGGLLEERPRMCLCGMLASDRDTLPTKVQSAVVAFFSVTEQWIERAIRSGIADGSLKSGEDPALLAHVTLAGLQGLILCARAHGDRKRFSPGADYLLSSVGVQR